MARDYSKRMRYCAKCGATTDISSSGYICRQCKKAANKAYAINTTNGDMSLSAKTKALLKYIITVYESNCITKSELELIYIDSCKIMGHSRKGYMLSQRTD